MSGANETFGINLWEKLLWQFEISFHLKELLCNLDSVTENIHLMRKQNWDNKVLNTINMRLYMAKFITWSERRVYECQTNCRICNIRLSNCSGTCFWCEKLPNLSTINFKISDDHIVLRTEMHVAMMESTSSKKTGSWQHQYSDFKAWVV